MPRLVWLDCSEHYGRLEEGAKEAESWRDRLDSREESTAWWFWSQPGLEWNTRES